MHTQRLRFATVLVSLLSFNPLLAHAGNDDHQHWNAHEAWESNKSDYGNFYSMEHGVRLGIAFGIGALMANTNIDQELRDRYQDHLRSDRSDNVARFAKNFGEGEYLIPLSLAAALLPDEQAPVGVWGQRTFRAFVLGGPALLAAQELTGGSRPGERTDASHWRPLSDNNGVSGHAFMGAVPFLTIARMSDNPLVRIGAYAASALPAWSRVNDDAHFPSQVLLGWYLGYEATDAVSESSAQHGKTGPQVTLIPWGEGAIVNADWRW